jgi:hypothetical protein
LNIFLSMAQVSSRSPSVEYVTRKTMDFSGTGVGLTEDGRDETRTVSHNTS